jgi:hypothetical protein
LRPSSELPRRSKRPETAPQQRALQP